MEILFDEHVTFGPAKVPVLIFDSEAAYQESQWSDTDYWEVNGQPYLLVPEAHLKNADVDVYAVYDDAYGGFYLLHKMSGSEKYGVMRFHEGQAIYGKYVFYCFGGGVSVFEKHQIHPINQLTGKPL